MTTVQIVLVCIAAALAGMGSVLDSFQTHRPLVACTLVGLVLGDMKTGIILGGMLEMMALGWMNIGVAMAPDTAMASVISTILVVADHHSIGEGVAFAAALATAGQGLTIFCRTLTIGLQHKADEYAKKGNIRAIERMHYAGLGIQALRVAVPTLIVCLISAHDFQMMLNAVPKVITKGLQIGSGLVVVVGYAMVINMMNAKYFLPLFFLGFILAAFTSINLVSFAVLGLIIAIIYCQMHPDYAATNRKRKASPPSALQNAENGRGDFERLTYLPGATGRRLTKKDLFRMFLRLNLLQGSFNFERIEAIGYSYAMIPAIKRLYKKGKERTKVLTRSLEFFSTQLYLAAPIAGIDAALEEERARGAKIKENDIIKMKVDLMGPFSGVGDPVFWGTIRPVLGAIGAALAMKGSLLGPLVFFVFFNVIRLTVLWSGVHYGYSEGVEMVSGRDTTRVKRLTEGATILGMFVIGALVYKWTSLHIPVVISKTTDLAGKTTTTTVQNVLDSLMPGLVPLCLTFLCAWLLRRKIHPLWLILAIFVVSVLGYWAHIIN